MEPIPGHYITAKLHFVGGGPHPPASLSIGKEWSAKMNNNSQIFSLKVADKQIG